MHECEGGEDGRGYCTCEAEGKERVCGRNMGAKGCEREGRSVQERGRGVRESGEKVCVKEKED